MDPQHADNPQTNRESPATPLGGRIDPQTVEALYAEHAGALRAFLIGLLKNPEAAEDVFQTVFTRVLDVGHTAEQGTQRGWLFRVAYQEAMLRKRKEGIETRSLQELARRTADQVAGANTTAEEAAIRREDTSRIREALKQLPREQQEVVKMRIEHAKTFQTIANELDVPLGTVLSRMRLGLARLMRAFEADN